MLNSLRDGQINYGTPNCPSVHVPPHNVVAPIHQNSSSLMSAEPAAPAVYPWSSDPRLEHHLYGFHSRYYNLDFPAAYHPPAVNQYAPANVYGQNVPQCCQPCCRPRSQNAPAAKMPSSQPPLYNPVRPAQPPSRPYKSKKTSKAPCSAAEQFLPYIPNDLPVKYDAQNGYQPAKYGGSYLNNASYCPPASNLWIPPPAANPTWPADILRPAAGVVPHDFGRDKNYERLSNYQSNPPYTNPAGVTHRPYNYVPSPVMPDVHDYRPPVYHNQFKNNMPEYVSHEHNPSRLLPPISFQNNQSLPSSSLQQYYNVQPAAAPPYVADVQRPNEPFKSQVTPQSAPKSNLNVREFLATWDEGEEEVGEKPSETTAPIVVLDCMTLEGDALTKVQEKLNVVSYENLEKVLKDNQNSLVIDTETNENDSIHNKTKPPSKPNFEPLDYTKRETGIIKPFISERKTLPGPNNQPEKNYSVNFDGMVAWYGKKNTDISSTDLIERLADRIFNLSKSQENEGVSFGTASYTGQITQTNNRSIESAMKDSSKYVQSQEMFDLQHRAGKCLEPSVINKIDCNNDAVPRNHSCVSNENNKTSTIKSNSINSSCIVENTTKKCLNMSNEEPTPWTLDQGSQEQHLNMSLYDHSVIMKPLDFSSLTDETKGNPFMFEKNTSNSVKPSDGIINDQYNKVFNENNNYNSTVSNIQHALHHQTDSSNRNFPVIVSPHGHRQEYNGFHESVIQRTGCDKNKQHDKVSTAQPDFENMNWNISNDLDKIMKHTNISMEPSCLYDSRGNYSNMLGNMNSDKIVSTQWKDNVSINSKINSTHHDSFFDGWNFIESYENHSSKRTISTSNNNNNNNNELHNPLFLNQMASVGESNNKNRGNNRFGEKVKNETSTLKDTSFSKPLNMSNNNNTHSRSVFNLNSRIPDFSDGFELSVMNNEPHEYMQFKKLSNDNEHRTDGSIFEHLAEPKCIRTTADEAANVKNDHNNKLDVVGLPSFKEKEPLAPMPVPPKLNVVKPIIRDPSQIYSVIKQKLKYDNPCVDNDNAASNKPGGHILRGDHTNVYNGTDLKSKYNNVQLNQFDVWSEKFVLKGNSNNPSSAVVQCDVEITQFKSTPENRNALIPKPNTGENYQDKNEKLPGNASCNLIADKMNVVESDDKINSNDFLNCLENAKTNDQKYRDTLDEFETSFGFDIHCNNESNKSFHEDIVDKCLEETIKDKIGEHNINTSDSSNNNSAKGNRTSSDNNNPLPFQCNFQSSYLIKNYFDENKNKAITALEQKQNSVHEKANFNYHRENEFELQNNKNVHATHNSDKNSNFNIINDLNRDVANRSKHDIGENNSNFINQTKLKYSFESSDENNDSKITSREKNRFDYLTIEHRNFEFENNKKDILKSTNCKEIIMNNNHSNVHDLANIEKQSSVDFENINNSANIFEMNSNISPESTNETNENRELQNNKISFESTLHSENTGNVEHRINNKNIFEVENNNSDLYQTHNLEKIHEFDFETRIIQNFEMECSNSNVKKPASQIEICTNKNQKNAKYSYERNDTENKIQKEINFNSPLSIHVKSQIEESSDVDCNDNTQFNNVVKTENKKNNIDNIFDVTDTEQEELNLEIRYTDLDTQNDKTEKINLNNKNNECSNTSINAEIENIFENLFDNLKTSNIEKDSNLYKNKSDDDKCNVSKSLENITDQNVQINNSNILRKDCIKRKCHNESDEAFEETNNVILLQEFVNNSTSHLMPISSLHKKMSEEAKYNELNELNEFDVREPVKHIPNKNENYLYIPKKTAAYKNIVTFKEKTIEHIKQNEIEIINQNNVQTVKNTTSNIIPGYTANNIFENIKSDLLTVKTTDKPLDEGFRQNYSTGPVLLNNFENTRQKHSSDLAEVEDSSSSDSSSLDHFESVRQEYLNEFSEFEDSSSSESNSLKYMKFKRHQNCKDDIEDLTNSGSSLINNVISKHQEHSNEIIEENSINSEPTSLNDVEFTCEHDSEDIVEVANTTFSPNHIDSTHQEHINKMIEAKDLSNSETSSKTDVEFTRQKDSNDIGDVDDSTSSKSNSLNHVKPTHQEHCNDMVDADDSIDSEPNSLNDVEFTCEHESEDIVEVENTFSPNRIGSSTHQEHFNEIIEANDLSNSETNSTTDVEFTRQKDSNDIGDVDDSTSSKSNSLNHVKPTHQEHYNDTIDADDSINSELNSLNDVEFTYEHESEDIVEFENTTFSPNYIGSKHQGHSNEIIEENSINSEHNSINDVEFTCEHKSKDIVEAENTTFLPNRIDSTHQEHFNELIEAKDLSDSETSSLNDVEFTCQKDFNDIGDVDDSTSSESNSLNRVTPMHQEHYNDTIDADDSINSEPNSLNDVEFTCEHEPEDIVEVENATFSPNHIGSTRQAHLNKMIEANDLSNSETSLLNDVEFTRQKDCNDIGDVGDSTSFESNSLNHVKPIHQERYNDMIDGDNSINSELNSLNGIEFTDQQSCKDVDVENSTSSRSSSLNYVDSTYQEHFNDVIEKNLINFAPTSLNDVEFSREQDSENITEDKGITCSLNQIEPTHQAHCNEIIEAVNFKPIVVDDVALTGQQHLNKIVDCSTSESLTLSKNDILQTNSDSYFKNIDCENVIDDVKLPKVKFMLKCRTKSMIGKNVFDEESTVPYQKRNAVTGEKLITRNMFKRRWNGSYKPWQNTYRKQWPSDEPKESAKTVAVDETASSPGDVVRRDIDCADGRGVISPAEPVAFAADEKEPNAVGTGENGVDDPCERPFARDDDHTPMPSPFDGFGSETQTPEHGDGVEYWDKSLEDEYRNVLRKTISKLAKACVRDVRDRFNTRLLARRTNATRLKKRRWRRRRRPRLVDDATKTRIVVVGDDCCGLDDDDGEPTAVSVPTTTKCKIKVQLPWGRIFNLNGREDLGRNGETSRGTKLVLGPAKVEVRLSRTPGKWHVAACESMTSSKSVVSVRRLVLQRATSPARDREHDDCDENDGRAAASTSNNSSAGGDGVGERSRKLPKIVIRRNGRDNNYTSYVRSGGGFNGGEDDGSPRLMVRLVRNRKLDAMAADGVTTLDLKHFSPIAESAPTATTTTTTDTYGPKRVRYE